MSPATIAAAMYWEETVGRLRRHPVSQTGLNMMNKATQLETVVPWIEVDVTMEVHGKPNPAACRVHSQVSTDLPGRINMPNPNKAMSEVTGGPRPEL